MSKISYIYRSRSCTVCRKDVDNSNNTGLLKAHVYALSSAGSNAPLKFQELAQVASEVARGAGGNPEEYTCRSNTIYEHSASFACLLH